MKTVNLEQTWSECWRISYEFDRKEVYGDLSHPGYTYAYLNRKKYVLDLIKKILKPGQRILDVAAGQGNFSLALAELDYEVTWNDIREELIGYVELKKEKGVIHYAPGNVFDLEFRSFFDLILITEIIEHTAYPDEFLKKIATMVKIGGYVVMTTPNGGYFLNSLPKFTKYPDPSKFQACQFRPDADGHIFLPHYDEIAVWAEKASLSIDKIDLFTNPLTNGHLKTHYLLRWLPFSFIKKCEEFTAYLPLSVKKKILIHLGALLRRSH